MMLRNTLRLFSTSSENLLKTAFYDTHVSLNGTMVEFAGYLLPVQYKGDDLGIINESKHCRDENGCVVFDVSHMGQLWWSGPDHVTAMEAVFSSDIQGLSDGHGRLSLIQTNSGGILDDSVIFRIKNDQHFMIVNGARKFVDMEQFDELKSDFNFDYEYKGDDSLLALQGPQSANVLSKMLKNTDLDFNTMPFMTTTVVPELCGLKNIRISRCGYTGEDGFEISIPANENAPELLLGLLEHHEVKPAGLGARDVLRLEAGLCLYGNDIDHTTLPTEAGLMWTIGGPKGRRRKEQNFLGSEKFLTSEGKLKKAQRKRIGFIGTKSKMPERTPIFNSDSDDAEEIGFVTSSVYSANLGQPIGMGYIQSEYANKDTDIWFHIRGRKQKASVADMPFITPRYFRGN